VFSKLNESTTIVVRSEWRDNPWFTPELEEERQLDLKLYPDCYATSGRASTPGRSRAHISPRCLLRPRL